MSEDKPTQPTDSDDTQPTTPVPAFNILAGDCDERSHKEIEHAHQESRKEGERARQKWHRENS